MEKHHFARSQQSINCACSRQASQLVLNSLPLHQEGRHPVNLRVSKFRFTASRPRTASHSGVTMGGCDDSGATRSPGRGPPGRLPATALPPGPTATSPRPIHYLLRHRPEQARPVLGDQFPIQAQFPQISIHGRRVLAGPRAALVPAVWGADGRLHVASPAAGQARRGLAPHGRAAGSSTPRPRTGGGSDSGSAGGRRRRRPEAAVRALRAHRGALPSAWLCARGRLPRGRAPRRTGAILQKTRE